MVKKVGILTAGGDCPGLNAVIRGIVKTAEYTNVETYGFLEGYKGLYNNNFIKLNPLVVSDIIAKGGTILGSNNKTNIFFISLPKITIINSVYMTKFFLSSKLHLLNVIPSLFVS